MADQLCTPEDLAAYLQMDLDRATAELLIEAATAIVQNAAGGQRILLVEDDEITLYLDHHDDPYWIYLPQRPVVEVTELLIGATAVTDWEPQYSRGRVHRVAGFRGATIGNWWTPYTVTVTYTHGYADGDQRLQLARSAVLSLAAGAYSNPSGAVREQIDDYAIQFAALKTQMQSNPALTRALRQQYGRSTNSIQLLKAGSLR